MNISTKSYLKFTQSVFKAIGCNKKDALQAAEVLLSADLRGIDSHGIARLSGYVRLYKKQRLNTRPHIEITHQTPSTAVLDADNGLGLVSGPQAMKIAIKKALQVGTGWVGVNHSNHFGIAGFYTMMALESDCIGIAMTNASPLVSPTFSKERLLGTNPISVAIPAGAEPPFVLDMATTTVANGKLEVLQRKGEKVPKGWVQDQEGRDSKDAFALSKGGAMRPLGGYADQGSYKGYGLGAVVDILSAVLTGANYGPWVPPFVSFINPLDEKVGKGIGHFFGAIRIDAFRPAEDFKNHMDNWIQKFRNSENISASQKTLIPGDPERKNTEFRLKNGIDLLPKVVEDLQELAEKLNIKL